MSNLQSDSQLERLKDGVTLQQLDDVCFVRLGDGTVSGAQTRELGEKLIAFIKKAGCRKLVMSFEGVESIYGFLLDSSEKAANGPHFKHESPKMTGEHAAGSDLWLG